MNTNDNCDGAGPHTEGEVRSLPIGAVRLNVQAILCRACFASEIRWRKTKNRKMVAEYPGYVFEEHDFWLLPSWAELEVYPKPDVAQEQARMRRRNAKTIGL